ncbi:EVA1B protein, partial [Nothoprocta pentlandii]|nr:EVA1B protein [Nothoprocta pentlandii]
MEPRPMELLSSSLAAFAHVRDNPESFGLYFVLGVCAGLLLTLGLLVLRRSCPPRPPRRGGGKDEDDDDEDDDDEEEEDTIDQAASESLLPTTELPPESPGAVNVFASAEELARAQRLEERERILREIW